MTKEEAAKRIRDDLRLHHDYLSGEYRKALNMAVDALEQPERKKGRWIEISLSNHTYKCSVCGRLLVNITDGKNNVAKNYPYCHCGADMRETNIPWN